MHAISRKKLVAFWEAYPETRESLAAWFKVADKAEWAKWSDVRRTYPKASYYKCCLIFNIVGGKYRLTARRALNWRTLYIVGVLTHAEYDRDLWKKFCTCR